MIFLFNIVLIDLINQNQSLWKQLSATFSFDVIPLAYLFASRSFGRAYLASRCQFLERLEIDVPFFAPWWKLLKNLPIDPQLFRLAVSCTPHDFSRLDWLKQTNKFLQSHKIIFKKKKSREILKKNLQLSVKTIFKSTVSFSRCWISLICAVLKTNKLVWTEF